MIVFEILFLIWIISIIASCFDNTDKQHRLRLAELKKEHEWRMEELERKNELAMRRQAENARIV